MIENAVCSKMEHTAEDGKTYQTQFYYLDAIISVDYRVNISQAKKKLEALHADREVDEAIEKLIIA